MRARAHVLRVFANRTLDPLPVTSRGRASLRGEILRLPI